jgi:hypothetical protein
MMLLILFALFHLDGHHYLLVKCCHSWEKLSYWGGLNGGNVSISLTINNIFHLSFLRCPFFWVGCYMYYKKVHAS